MSYLTWHVLIWLTDLFCKRALQKRRYSAKESLQQSCHIVERCDMSYGWEVWRYDMSSCQPYDMSHEETCLMYDMSMVVIRSPITCPHVWHVSSWDMSYGESSHMPSWGGRHTVSSCPHVCMTTSTWGHMTWLTYGLRMTTSSVIHEETVWQPPHDNLLMWRLSCRPYDNLWQPAHVEVVRMTKETYNITCKGDVIGLFWRLSCRPYDNLWQPPHVEVVMWRLSCMTRQPYDRCDMSYGCHTADMRRYDWQISFAKRGVEIWHVLMSVLSHDMTMSCRCNALIDAMHSSRYVTHRDMSLIDVMHSSM